MTDKPSHEAHGPWPTHKSDREAIVQRLVQSVMDTPEAQEFVHRVTLGRMELGYDEWLHIAETEANEDWDWSGEETYQMHLYAQYWETNSAVWMDLCLDVVIAFRGHPEDLKEGKVDKPEPPQTIPMQPVADMIAAWKKMGFLQ